MSTYRGNAFLKDSVIQDSQINHSSIANSTLDMANQRITSVSEPLVGSDSATKQYVDSLGIRFNDIVLTGVNKSVISTVVRGSFVVTVTNSVQGGPTAIFNVTKNNSDVAASVTRTAMTPGHDNMTGLDIIWPPSQGIQLYKSTSAYNGNYIIKIF